MKFRKINKVDKIIEFKNIKFFNECRKLRR